MCFSAVWVHLIVCLLCFSVCLAASYRLSPVFVCLSGCIIPYVSLFFSVWVSPVYSVCQGESYILFFLCLSAPGCVHLCFCLTVFFCLFTVFLFFNLYISPFVFHWFFDLCLSFIFLCIYIPFSSLSICFSQYSVIYLWISIFCFFLLYYRIIFLLLLVTINKFFFDILNTQAIRSLMDS